MHMVSFGYGLFQGARSLPEYFWWAVCILVRPKVCGLVAPRVCA